ncbi:hypothetical protein KY290_025287 [Solanum tuberosum]|uniref:Integrase core domain containing protein n=1 Tax=Solanum tuberosum TaxID=4113 RepID=A0ABQ7UV82_SOLTU|nr:hypothetical protein KY290_025287 [Solanum tuberosum]
MKIKYRNTARVKRAQLQALRKYFETLQIKEEEFVISYNARIMKIRKKKTFHSEKMNDVTIVEKILHSLMLKYDYAISSIEESKGIDEFSLDELYRSLLVHEQKINHSSTSEEQALKASTYTLLILEEEVEVGVEDEREETLKIA